MFSFFPLFETKRWKSLRAAAVTVVGVAAAEWTFFYLVSWPLFVWQKSPQSCQRGKYRTMAWKSQNVGSCKRSELLPAWVPLKQQWADHFVDVSCDLQTFSAINFSVQKASAASAMGRLAKWYYNCELPSQSACRVILIAVFLSIIHSVGILISVYYLLTR